MRLLSLALSTCILCFSSVSSAKVRVVTTSTDLASLVSEIGQEHVSVESIGKANQDIHYVQARPSFMVQLRRADLVVSLGLDLETAWLPLLLRGARNSTILPGTTGYLELGDLIEPLAVPKTVDASQGHLHPRGNPHYWLDPLRIKSLLPVIEKRLSLLDPTNSDAYASNAKALIKAFDTNLAKWDAQMAPYRGTRVISYHDTFLYFINRYQLLNVDTLEPKPGVPPSPKHLSQVIVRAKQAQIPIIFHESYHDKRPSGLVASRSGASLLILPVSVNATPNTETYIQLIDTIVGQFTSTMAKRVTP